MFNAISGMVTFDLNPIQPKYTGRYYPTRGYHIWDFYGRDLTKSQVESVVFSPSDSGLALATLGREGSGRKYAPGRGSQRRRGGLGGGDQTGGLDRAGDLRGPRRSVRLRRAPVGGLHDQQHPAHPCRALVPRELHQHPRSARQLPHPGPA